MSLLHVENLKKIFPPNFIAVNNISFSLQESEILGLLGPNGAGKTTTIQMLLSTLTPTGGTINYFGKDFAAHRSEILEKVAFASTYVKLPPRLTVRENLDIYGRLYGMTKTARDHNTEKFLKFFGMWESRDKQLGLLSAGQTTRVMLAKAFLAHPKIVLLDEPTAALDPDIAQEVRQFVIHQKKEYGVSILFTSHNMDEVTEVCDRVLVLKNGKIIANDTPQTLAASVASAKVHFIMQPAMLIRATQFAAQHNYFHATEDNAITIEVDEQAIAKLLMNLATEQIVYEHISVDKPSLEDYFLHIAKG